MMKKIAVLLLALGVFASGTTFTALAQDDMTPAERAAAAVDTRKSLFKVLRFNIGPIGAMAQGAPFDAEVAERNARRIASLASMIPEVLAYDTSDFDNIETTALDSIWENQEQIQELSEALATNANTFASLAAGGDMAQTLGAFRQLGGSCGNCHDEFRTD